MFTIFLKGAFLGASLIIAIGVQNAFILRQGLKNRHVFASALTASSIDAFLIGAGVLGFGLILENFPGLIDAVKYVGAAFLFVYGVKSFRDAFANKKLDQDKAKGKIQDHSLRHTIIFLMGVSFLNPHVYLDTVILIGGLSASYGETGKYYFGAGAMIASFIWFFALAYGARFLAPLFEKPRAWQILDVLIGLVMWAIALSLLL